MTWDPYGMPHAPSEPQDHRRDRRQLERPPASMRLVAAVLFAMVLLALVFTIAANAQETTTEQQGSETATQEQAQQPEATGTTQATEGGAQPSEAAEAEPAPLAGQIVEQPEGTYAASDLIGRSVMSAEGEAMGDIKDLLVTEDNRITGIVVGIGGFLGIGEKQIAVELDHLKRTTTQEGAEQLVLGFARQELEQAPAFVSLAEQKRRLDAEQARQQQEQQQGSGDTSGQLMQ